MAHLGEGLTRRKRPRDADMGGASAAETGPSQDAKKGRPDEAAKAAVTTAGAAKAVADLLPGADLPPVLAPPGR